MTVNITLRARAIVLAAFVIGASLYIGLLTSGHPFLWSEKDFDSLLRNQPIYEYNGCKNIEMDIQGKGDNVSDREKRQVVFLKVHKAASTTVQNIFFRFAVSRDLNVLLTKNTYINERSDSIPFRAILHRPKAMQFDILCNHIVFNKDVVSKFFPNSTMYVGIVRDPFAQALSALIYYYEVYPWADVQLMHGVRKHIEHPVLGFLQSPEDYYNVQYGPRYSFLNNRMSVDFGVPPSQFEAAKKNSSQIQDFLKSVENNFHLIMVAEYFDESLVLLRRLLNWTTKDIIYKKQNAVLESPLHNATGPFSNFREMRVKENFSVEDLNNFKLWAAFDYALYDHFRNILLDEIAHQKHFTEEVEHFKIVNNIVFDLCEKMVAENDQRSVHFVEETKFTDSFRLVLEDCVLMKTREEELVPFVRAWQSQRFNASIKTETEI